ncbi:uncharacterized protein LOC125683166 [Ostrea edulis]|uniref:uncharacterized protein LOC125683166 n=1 Tax=Ostrea edulis TaxID=37623 RepID=UPI0020960CC9|nr:uncharacterized protein LOC125683166 [Ostrea edulis]
MSDLESGMEDRNKNEESIIDERLKVDFTDVLHRLDDMKIDADLNISEVTKIEEEDNSETQSIEEHSSVSEIDEDNHSIGSGQDGKKSASASKRESSEDKKKGGSVLSKLRKLTKFDKTKSTPAAAPTSKFLTIRVDKLPQIFVAKYLGKKEVKGVFGLHHVRKPVDELVKVVKDGLLANEKVELPLSYVVISGRGIDVREHKSNSVKDKLNYGLIPIDFISYGVQDIKYWKVFTFIVVNRLSSRSKETECHAYLCDSTANCRRMALALGVSFNVYRQKLASQGKSHNFQVELRPPDELADEFGKDFEA